MRRYLLFSGLYFLLGLLAACSNAQNKAGFEELNPQSFQAQLKSHAGVLLDVRTPQEFAAGHIAQAKNIDYKDSNFRSALSKLDKDETYYVYCKAGVRSSKAGDMMQELGFTKVYLLDGGVDAWKEAGLPLDGK